jgi:hypothetical protein
MHFAVDDAVNFAKKMKWQISSDLVPDKRYKQANGHVRIKKKKENSNSEFCVTR